MNLKRKISSKGIALIGLFFVVISIVLSKRLPNNLIAESIAVVINIFGFILIVLGIYRIIKNRISKKGKDNYQQASKDISTSKSSKMWVSVIAVAIIIFGVSFYWLSIRPSQIRKQCSQVSVKTYSQERKNEAQKYVDDNCQQGRISLEKVADCVINRNILKAPLDGQEQKNPATDDEYIKCLRENGLEENQSLANKQLKNLQQGIDNQSAKIENLQKENNDMQSNSSLSRSIIEAQKQEADQENAKCQQELSEYSACIGEYNADMAEYNSCLAESSDPNSWRYGHGMLCSKPSNYCFKPLCAY